MLLTVIGNFKAIVQCTVVIVGKILPPGVEKVERTLNTVGLDDIYKFSVKSYVAVVDCE